MCKQLKYKVFWHITTDKIVSFVRQKGNVHTKKTTHWEAGNYQNGSCLPLFCVSGVYLWHLHGVATVFV